MTKTKSPLHPPHPTHSQHSSQYSTQIETMEPTGQCNRNRTEPVKNRHLTFFYLLFFFSSLGHSFAVDFLDSRKGITGGLGDKGKTEREVDRVRGAGSIFDFNWNLNTFSESVRVCRRSSVTLLPVAIVP